MLDENHAQSEPRNQESDIHQMSDHIGDSGNNTSIETGNWQASASQGGDWQGGGTEDGRREWEQSDEVEFNDWQEVNAEEMDGNWQVNPDQDWPGENPENEDGGDSHLQEVHEEWHENSSQDVVDDWQDGLRSRQAIPVRRLNRFHPPDDDNVYSMELRELLSRYIIYIHIIFCSMHLYVSLSSFWLMPVVLLSLHVSYQIFFVAGGVSLIFFTVDFVKV